MPSFAARLESAPPPLWLESDAYAGRLLASGGRIPWLDAGAWLSWQRKVQGLLHSDVVTLPAEPVFAAVLAAQPEIRTAMAAKSRLLFPLKTLLGQHAPRTHLCEMLQALRSSFASTVIALRIPSPRRWIGLAFAQSGQGEPDEIGDDDVDSAGMYLADFLRSFGECGMDVLLLEEDLGSEPSNGGQLAVYQPVINVAEHYRWTRGLKLPDTSVYRGAIPGFEFGIAPAPLEGTLTGVCVPETFWGGGPLPGIGERGFRYAPIPESARPETVLERLQVLR